MIFLEACRRLTGLDTTPSHGNHAAAEFVGELCRGAGLHVDLQNESQDGIDQCNVIARPQPIAPDDEILFQSHLDTQDAGNFSDWTKTQSNPFNASIYNDVLFGLGVADTKLDFLCKIEAAREVMATGRPLRRPFVLAATFGAHNGMAGAIKLIRRKKLNAKCALVGAPTGLRLVNAGKGLAVIEISLPFSDEEREYRQAHDLLESASTQSRIFAGKNGENAIMKMFEHLAQLPDGIAIMNLDGGVNHTSLPASAVLEIDTVAGFREPLLPKMSQLYASLLDLENELRGFRDEAFSPPHPTMNLGMIRTFATDVRVSGSVHLPPSVTDVVYEAWMRKLEAAVRAVGATFRVKDYRKGFFTAPDSEFLQKVCDVASGMGLSAALDRLAQPSEASVFSRHGIHCVLCGPGFWDGRRPGPNESVQIEELNAATQFYRALMERFCL